MLGMSHVCRNQENQQCNAYVTLSHASLSKFEDVINDVVIVHRGVR